MNYFNKIIFAVIAVTLSSSLSIHSMDGGGGGWSGERSPDDYNFMPEDAAPAIPWMNGNYYSEEEIVQNLLDTKVNVNEPDNEGMTPLHWATKHGEQIVTEFLLTHGASVNTQTKKGETPLHFAAWNDRQVIAQMLIAVGAAVDTQDMYGQTPLYGAAGKGHTKILQILIEHGAPVNQPKLMGYTPLYGAAFCGKPETIQMLIAAGAKFNGHDNQDKQNPLQIATQQGHKLVVDLLSHYIGIAQTIALSTHKILGATSPMALLSQNLMKDITCLVVQSEAYDACHPQKQCQPQKQNNSSCTIL